MTKENYTLQEISELGILPYSWKTLRRMIERGDLNADVYQMGKRQRFVVSRQELDRVRAVLRRETVHRQDTAGTLETN